MVVQLRRRWLTYRRPCFRPRRMALPPPPPPQLDRRRSIDAPAPSPWRKLRRPRPTKTRTCRLPAPSLVVLLHCRRCHINSRTHVSNASRLRETTRQRARPAPGRGRRRPARFRPRPRHRSRPGLEAAPPRGRGRVVGHRVDEDALSLPCRGEDDDDPRMVALALVAVLALARRPRHRVDEERAGRPTA